MSYKKEVLEKNQIKFTVEVDSADWTKAIDEAYNKTKHKFQIEGFRKGKVPKRMIEKMYGTNVFFEDALDIILPKYYGNILDKETEIYPVAQPDIDISAISDTTLVFTAVVTCKPEVKLDEYKNLTVKVSEYLVTDEMIDAEIAKAQERACVWTDVTDRPCANGDQVIVDYSGSVDGNKFDGGTAEAQTLELGSGTFIPGFEEQVVGMNIGDNKDINVTFPEEYGAENLAGKKAVFAITLKEIKNKVLPSIDEEFVKDVSEFNTVEEYKSSIKNNLEVENEKKATAEKENTLMQVISDKCELDIPEAMVTNQIEDMIQEFEYRLMYQGLKVDDYYKYTKTSREDLVKNYHDTAMKNVRIRLVMEAIIKAENITASEEEISAKIADFAKGANKEVEEYKSTIRPEQMNYINNEIVTDKLMVFLLQNNKFN